MVVVKDLCKWRSLELRAAENSIHHRLRVYRLLFWGDEGSYVIGWYIVGGSNGTISRHVEHRIEAEADIGEKT